MWNSAPTALERSASTTSSETNVWRAGAVERGDAPQQKRKHVYVPQLDQPGDGEDAQSQRQRSHGRLGGEQEFSPVEMIGGETRQAAAREPAARTGAP